MRPEGRFGRRGGTPKGLQIFIHSFIGGLVDFSSLLFILVVTGGTLHLTSLKALVIDSCISSRDVDSLFVAASFGVILFNTSEGTSTSRRGEGSFERASPARIRDSSENLSIF